MKVVRASLLFFVLSLICICGAQADDSQYWGSVSASVKVSERIKLNLLEQFRLKSDMGNFYTYVQYAGISYKVNDYFDSAAWYKLVSSKKDQNWSESHRFDLDGTLKFNIEEFKISNRSRFERNTTAASWLYRDRIKLARAIELFNRKWMPFISNEFFFDLKPDNGYHENRAVVGVSTDFVWDTKLTVYYMSRSKKSDGDWSNANVLGTTLGFSF